MRNLLKVVLFLLLLTGCGSITPAPRYTRPATQNRTDVVQELEARESAGKSRLLRVVESYLGVPYKWGGTTRRGMDCSAFARAIYRETYGIELPRTSRQMYRLGQQVPALSRLQPGDLVFFSNTYAGPGISHVGVYIGHNRFAHASSSQGGVITGLDAPYFQKRYAGARRIRR